MSAKQLAHFRKILEALKKELSEDIDRTVHTMQDEATVFADPNDRASQETDMAIELRNRDRERKLIKKIDETLAALKAAITASATSAASRSASSAWKLVRPQRCALIARRWTNSRKSRWRSNSPVLHSLSSISRQAKNQRAPCGALCAFSKPQELLLLLLLLLSHLSRAVRQHPLLLQQPSSTA
jgi:RNA polymerase-binding protein DksA